MATSLTRLLTPFAKSIHAKCEAHNDVSLELTVSQRARHRESISDDIKKCSNFVVPEVSEAALAVAIDVDLYAKNWHDQHFFDPGRENFHFEHVVPVSAIRERCLEAASDQDVLRVLEQEIRVAWILKAEDAELTRLGFRSKRECPDEAYLRAKIRLVKRVPGDQSTCNG